MSYWGFTPPEWIVDDLKRLERDLRLKRLGFEEPTEDEVERNRILMELERERG